MIHDRIVDFMMVFIMFFWIIYGEATINDTHL